MIAAVKGGAERAPVRAGAVVTNVADVAAEANARSAGKGPGKAIVGPGGDTHGGVAEAHPVRIVAAKIDIAPGPVRHPLCLLSASKRQGGNVWPGLRVVQAGFLLLPGLVPHFLIRITLRPGGRHGKVDAGHVRRQVSPAMQLLQAVAEVTQLRAGKILCGLILRAHQSDDVSILRRVGARGNGQGYPGR